MRAGTERLAVLPMYDLPELRGAHDALWAWLAQRMAQDGVECVPTELSRSLSYEESWCHPGLLLGQGCEYPLALRFAGHVRIIATPRYAVDGCEGSYYRSALVVRKADSAQVLRDLRSRRCVINDPTSNSGMNLLRAAVAPLAGDSRFFGSVAVSGSHRRSIEMVASEEADLAAVDCVTWGLLQRHCPRATVSLRVLGWTPRSPSLPFITARSTDSRTLTALVTALEELSTDDTLRPVRNALLLDSVRSRADEDYSDVLNLEQRAVSLGYGSLR